jgi:hypothetical protein
VPHIGYVNTGAFLHVNISYDICLILPRVYPTKIIDLFLISAGAETLLSKMDFSCYSQYQILVPAFSFYVFLLQDSTLWISLIAGHPIGFDTRKSEFCTMSKFMNFVQSLQCSYPFITQLILLSKGNTLCFLWGRLRTESLQRVLIFISKSKFLCPYFKATTSHKSSFSSGSFESESVKQGTF